MSQALVLGAGATSLRASAWLAAGGTAVRHLGLGPAPLEVRWPVHIRGVPADLSGWLGPVQTVGPSVGVWYRGKLHPMPTRRRDLATLVRGSWVALAQDLRPRLRAPRTLGQWGVRHLGRAGWQRCLRTILSKRLGVSCDAEPAALAGLLSVTEGARWCTPVWSREMARDSQIDAVLDAGGDVVHDVTVDALEVEDGRIAAVLTEFGRERIDRTLVTDVAPWRLAKWLPNTVMGDAEVATLRALPMQERALVDVHLSAPVTLPWTVWVADAHLPVVELHRAWGQPGAPADNRLTVELQSHPGDERARAWARDFVAKLGPVSAVGEVRGVVQPLPTRDPRAVGALRRLRAVGIQPVGPVACHRPYTLEHEARLGVGRPRPELLTLPADHHGVLP